MWTPKTLKCQIYEDNVLLDLNKCSVGELEAILDCVYPLWKTSEHSAIWFDIDVFEKHHLFKPVTRTIEIGCYVYNQSSFTHRKQVSMSKIHYDHMVGRKIPIQPKNTLCHKWKFPVEIAFVA
jgi:hypothetical protein